MTGRLVLIGKSSIDRMFAEYVAKELKFEWRCFADLAQAEEHLDSGDLIIFDAISQDACSEFEDFARNFKTSSLHYLCSSPSDLCTQPHLIDSTLVSSWLCRPSSPTEHDCQSFAPLYAKILIGCREGSNSLAEGESEKECLQLSDSIQKELAAQAVGGVCTAHGCNSRTADIIATSIDELIMNAIYNAPADNSLLIPDPRVSIDLTAKNAVEVQTALLQSFLRVSVIDLHGTFKRNIFLEHVARGYNGFQSEGMEQRRSPGIGLATIFRSGGNMFIDVDTGARTSMHVYFDIGNSFRKTRDAYRVLATRFS